MRGHVFAVGFPDDAEGSRVGVRYVGDRVSVQGHLVRDGTDLLDGQLRAGLAPAGKGHLEGLVVAERDVGAGAQASRGMLGGRCGILLRGLGHVLIQSLENSGKKKKKGQ